MEVICRKNAPFYALIDKVVQHFKETHSIKEPEWISRNEAMQMLGIKSKSSLQKLRDQHKITFTEHLKKNILYDPKPIRE